LTPPYAAADVLVFTVVRASIRVVCAERYSQSTTAAPLGKSGS
jgi:hypothetical protein